ncbi:MAG TPA: M4 family metallopeptidase [Kofleriaceae bacterium]|nr:M4 family metallopeptidase [Kofleriaceae bacterium]
MASATGVQAIGAPTAPGLGAAYALASSNAAALVASRPAFLHASPNDAFVQGNVVSSGGVFYVPHERTYAGLRVVGGDFVMVLDGAGQVTYTSSALERPIELASITPSLSRAAAETIATQRLRSVTGVEGTELVVNALGATPRLAWESTVNGFGANGISRLTVDVDALTGAVLREQEHVLYGSGTSAWNGPNPVTLNTTLSGSTFSMRDPTITNLSCQDAANNTTFSGTDDLWGNGNATVRETGCVDALFGAQTEAKMLTQWLGRNAMDGAGGAWPIRVGLAQVNAFYDGTQVQVGHNNANQWIGAIDVIAHEMGHGIDDHTPGGISGNGTQEFIADTFGASTEWFANEPSPFDVPDFTVGEQINLVGSGPIRNMANPSLVNGDPNCFSSAIPTTEVHAAAGPGNHWFYLLAEGSNPTDGQPTSPTCNGSTVVGLGIQNAIKILYNAMLMKTTGSSYLRYRTWTLQAAINLNPGNCAPFNTVKAAWDAVSVPAQAGDPTCSSGPNFSLSASPASRTVVQGTSTTYTVTETPSGGFTGSVTLAASGLPTGATAAFSPNPTTGTSTLTVTTATTTPTGSFTITITGTSGTLSHTTTVTLVVTGTGGCGVNLLLNPGFETVGANWTATAGVLGNAGQTTHTGTQIAWLDGYGTTHTDTLSQSVTSTCPVTQLCFWLRITTAETTTTTQFDKLTVQFRGTTLGTFSNLNAAAFSTFKQACFPVSGTPSAAAVNFVGTEDSSLQTSFFIDDVSLQ